MSFGLDCIAIIPCHNEAANIADVVTAVRGHLLSVMVVDDSSTDETAKRAADSGAEVIRLKRHQGKGACLRVGFHEGLSRGFRNALTLDGDGQHRISDIPHFLDLGQQSRAGLIVGNRMERPARMPLLRRAVNAFMSATLSLASGQSMPDTQCGFRLIRLEPAFVERLSANHYETESDQIVAALELDWEIAFVPTACVYHLGPSGIRPIPDTIRWLRWLCRTRNRLGEVRRRHVDSKRSTLSNPQPASLRG